MTDFTKLSPEDLARVTTRDGRKVEIITTKGREPQPVIGYAGLHTNPSSWCANGKYLSEGTGHKTDLILPPAPRVYYANLYPNGFLNGHNSLENARQNRASCWLALYKITDDGENVTIEVIERNKGA